jgi:hypothetical protein
MSGMVKSRQYPDIFWVHGDSGNSPTLHAIDRSGKTIARFLVRGGNNRDWEDIAIDDDGNLYVGDIGNNSFRLKRLTVYQVPEPDPRQGNGEVQITRAINYQYEEFEDKGFASSGFGIDAEALFHDGQHLYVLAKNWDKPHTELYRFPTLVSEELITVELISEASLVVTPRQRHGLVTGADLSPDKVTLAVLTYDYLFLFRVTDGDYLGERIKAIPIDDNELTESVAWDASVILVGNEGGFFWPIDPSGDVASGNAP